MRIISRAEVQPTTRRQKLVQHIVAMRAITFDAAGVVVDLDCMGVFDAVGVGECHTAPFGMGDSDIGTGIPGPFG